MKMWIIQVGEPLPELDGATRQMRCAMLTSEAVRSGHHVTRWGSTFSHFDKTRRATGETVRRFGENLEIRLVHGPGYRMHRSPKRLLHHRAEANSFLRQAAQCEKPDLIFSCLPTSHLCKVAVAFGRERGIPVVVDVRDLWPDQYLTIFPPSWRRWVKPLLVMEYRSLRNFLSRASGITAISESFLKWGLKNAGRERTSSDGVFPIGYQSDNLEVEEKGGIQSPEDVLNRPLAGKPDDFTVLFVGTFVSSFDFNTVLLAARRLEEQGSGVRFLLAGAGGYEAKMRVLAEGLKNVSFLGWIKNPKELRALHQLANAGLAPYRRDCTMSLPNKPFEYMAAGLPQISSLEGEMAQIIEREKIGVRYASDDVDGLCQSIMRLAGDRREAQNLGQNARRLFLREYASEVIYPRLLHHLTGVAAKSGSERLSMSFSAA